jgi:hypothetical protein
MFGVKLSDAELFQPNVSVFHVFAIRVLFPLGRVLGSRTCLGEVKRCAACTTFPFSMFSLFRRCFQAFWPCLKVPNVSESS